MPNGLTFSRFVPVIVPVLGGATVLMLFMGEPLGIDP